jgi:hypothetical protein
MRGRDVRAGTHRRRLRCVQRRNVGFTRVETLSAFLRNVWHTTFVPPGWGQGRRGAPSLPTGV